MPVYEYECQSCEKVMEIQQRMSDDPLTNCPDCDGPVKKLVSMSSFQLKGGGWYADGYSSASGKNGVKEKTKSSPPPCQSTGSSGDSCKSCPAAAH